MLKKEVFGVQLDEFYNKMITIFETYIFEIFGAEMKKVKFECKFENRGFFRLEYMYRPNNYRIIIENEYRTYDIDIVDEEDASNSLYRICKFKNSLAKEDIENGIQLLKETLEKNNFNMYFEEDGELYKKNALGVQKVKDIRELLNG